MNGLELIQHVFEGTKKAGRAALMPYFTLGYPDLDKSLAIIERIAASGADLIELGVPFSDPLADGPTIQKSTQTALENGITVSKCLDAARTLRERGISQPLLLMGYYNPILSYGVEKFVMDASDAGIDGLIVPDLPPEEASDLDSSCALNNLAMVYLVAPTSTHSRIEYICSHSTGFVYLVSLLGVTGARRELSSELNKFISRVRNVTDKPLAVGFGISKPDQVRSISEMADGVIVGSAVINAAGGEDEPELSVGDFIKNLSEASRPG